MALTIDLSSMDEESNRDDIIRTEIFVPEITSKKRGKQKIAKKLSIRAELDQYNLSDEIKERAEEICEMVFKKNVRKDNRTNLLFYCIYEAFKTINESVNPYEIGKMLGMDRKQMVRAINQNTFMGHRHKNVLSDPTRFFEMLIRRTPLTSDEVKPIIETYDIVIEADQKIKEGSPILVSAAVVCFHMKTNGVTNEGMTFDESIDFFCAENNLKKENVIDLMKKVEIAYNS